MRTIKFRAWKSWRKPEMLYPPSFNLFWSEKSKSQTMVYKDEDSTYRADCNWLFDAQWNMPLMQFTGMADKNGKEIYESDIAKITWTDYSLPEYPEGYQYTELGVMGWNQKSAQFSFLLKDSLFKDNWDNLQIEIIGNIYENPELLQEGRGNG